MLDPKTLAMMRDTLECHFMRDVIEIYNVGLVKDMFAQETIIRTRVATVSGQIQNVSGSERALLTALADEGIEQTESIKLVLPAGTAITANQQVATASGVFWNVAHVSNKTFIAALEVLVTRAVVVSGIASNY